MYISCSTQEEIAEEVGLTVGDKALRLSGNLEEFPNNQKLLAHFQDIEFELPIYNIWTFAKKPETAKKQE